ncbi:MAG TPA: acyl transferase, partial [Microscillaceae bacterium]|nr:acyl transferase [Microscillaceae bacterium]
ITFFKDQVVLTDLPSQEAICFESSGTTGQIPSRHWVSDPDFYRKASQAIFEQQYGALTNFHFLALLPSYLQRGNSSLVFMMDHFIRESGSTLSGFFLDDWPALQQAIDLLHADQQRQGVLIGVTYALLDFAEAHPQDLSHLLVMETGGMKGRRREMIRSEVHQVLQEAFRLPTVHSEYGMTELLSQAYSQADEIFTPPVWMRVLLRDAYDPLSLSPRKTGAINLIDLANVDSCAFIATQDIGEMVNDNQFKVLGRLDNSDLRGCNLLLSGG